MALARSLAITKAPTAPGDAQKGEATPPKTATVDAVLIGYGLIFVAWAAAYGLWKWRRAIGFDIPAEVDMAVTGIAIGSGTKPLHDLISNLQKSKEKKEDPKETGGTV